MDFMPGQVVLVRAGADIYDSEGRLARAPASAAASPWQGGAAEVAGAAKFIVSTDPRRRGQWFWAYPVYLSAAALTRGEAVWIRTADLRPYNPFPHQVGALQQLTPLGVVVPPIGIYQLAKGDVVHHAQPEGAPGAAATPTAARASTLPWATIASLTIIAGGALAVYLIYVASERAIPMQERAGRAAARVFGSHIGSGGSRGSRAAPRSTWLPPPPRPRAIAALPPYRPSAGADHPLLGAYEAYAPGTGP